jgi:DNA adenine methylase
VAIRILGIDRDRGEATDRAKGYEMLVATRVFQHGWRECHLVAPAGHVSVAGVLADQRFPRSCGRKPPARSEPFTMRPFLKWAGGKYRLVERIRARLPQGTRLVEPFAGSAAVFLNTAYPSALIADANRDLINLYRVIQQEGMAFIEDCRPLFSPENNQAERYYAFRERFNTTRDEREKAALFLYLNRHGYNGLCRYNGAGHWNVPFGRYQRPYFPERELQAFWVEARRATFWHADFRAVLASCVAGDVVYCDPPYVPLSSTASFTDYAAGGFGAKDQLDLAHLARALGARGIPVLISNHETAFTLSLYHDAVVERFGVQRFISRDGARRQVAGELLAAFGI